MAKLTGAAADAAIEMLNHFAKNGMADELKDGLRTLAKDAAEGAMLPAVLKMLAGLAGAPLAWGAVLAGGFLLKRGREARSAKEKQEQADALYKKVCAVEAAVKQNGDLAGLADELFGQNILLREQLEKGLPAIEAFKAAAREAMNEPWRAEQAAQVAELREGVEVYLQNMSEWIGEIKRTQHIALAEQRDGFKKVDAVLTEQQRMTAAIEQLAANLEASQAGAQVQGLQAENESLRARLTAVTERYLEAVRYRGRPWREVIDELRHDPKRLGAFLDTETERGDLEQVEQHRERAAVWYLTGEIDKAIASLIKILALEPDDIWATNQLGHIRLLRGELDEAARLYSRISEYSTDEGYKAVSLGNLGVVERFRGNLEAAEKYLAESLVINKKLGCRVGMAVNYSNLGLIEKTRGHLSGARAYHKKALAIDERLGRQREIAIHYGNLGVVERLRGNLDGAVGYYTKSLALAEGLESQAEMANAYCNLGVVEQQRGNLDRAEVYHKKAMEIDEKLGRKEGIATNFGNLGAIQSARGRLDAAAEYYHSALAIHEKLGPSAGMASAYCNLGTVEQARENLDAAEECHKNALSIDEKLGRRDGVATHFRNLGVVEGVRGDLLAAATYFRKSLAIWEALERSARIAAVHCDLGVIEQLREDLDSAEVHYRKALAIDKGLGRQEGMASGYGNLGLIAAQRGDATEARRLLTLSRDLYRKIGAKAMEGEVQVRLDELG